MAQNLDNCAIVVYTPRMGRVHLHVLVEEEEKKFLREFAYTNEISIAEAVRQLLRFAIIAYEDQKNTTRD